MTNEQILKKAIEKAIKNGWYKGKEYKEFYEVLDEYSVFDSYNLFFKDEVILFYSLRDIIFSHDFAKHLWGKGNEHFVLQDKIGTTIEEFTIESWKGHLQMMVLEEEPLQYIKKFLTS